MLSGSPQLLWEVTSNICISQVRNGGSARQRHCPRSHAQPKAGLECTPGCDLVIVDYRPNVVQKVSRPYLSCTAERDTCLFFVMGLFGVYERGGGCVEVEMELVLENEKSS